nr:hypothetical protein [Tanacetum cinerariifolium]
MRRVGKGCSGVETPIFEGMLVAREPKEQGDVEEQGNANNAAEEPVTAVDDVITQSTQSPTILTPPPQQHQDIPSTSQVQSPPPQQQSPPPAQPQGAHFPMNFLQEALDACVALTRRVEHLEHDKVAQDLEIIKLKKLERANKVKIVKLRRLKKVRTSQRIESSADTIMKDVSNQGRMTEESNKDEGAKVEALDTYVALTRRVEHLEQDKVAQNLEITKLKTRRIESSDDTIMKDVFNQGRIIDELDKDEGAVLMNEKDETKEVQDITGNAQVEGRQ